MENCLPRTQVLQTRLSLDCKVTSEDCAQSFDCNTEAYSHTLKSPKSFAAESKEASQEAHKVRTDCFEVTKQSTSHKGHLHKLSDVSRKPIAIRVNGNAIKRRKWKT
ncbi:uncharacterized protein [Drosophila takahashii]|uniref:uncharacterized protein n=1 Tax=Drosophila takahashii TaxID=29030 RepID=UPI003898DC38